MELVTGILSAFFGGIAQLIGMGQQAKQAQVANDQEKEALRQELERQRQLLRQMEEKAKQQQMMMYGVIGVAIVVVIIMMLVRR
jgi:hypothetical protein